MYLLQIFNSLQEVRGLRKTGGIDKFFKGYFKWIWDVKSLFKAFLRT